MQSQAWGGVVAEIILPNDLKDSSFPDEELVEIGSSGIYKGAFTPDTEGEWKVICHKADGDGQVVKRFSVGLHNVSSVGEGVTNVDGKVVSLDAKVDSRADGTDGLLCALENVSKAEVNVEVDSALADYAGAKEATVAKDATVAKTGEAASAGTAIRGGSETLETLKDQLNTVDGKVSSLDTPPMVS